MPSPPHTCFILLGASAWPKFPSLNLSLAHQRSYCNAARLVEEYVLDPNGLGLCKENFLNLFDSILSPDHLDECVKEFLLPRSKPIVDILVYYVGHGVFCGNDNALYLTLQCTKSDNASVSSLGMPVLATRFQESARRARKYIILDCCFAGAAVKTLVGFSSPPVQVIERKIQAAFRRGTALLCASGANDPAVILPAKGITMFTAAVVSTLRSGVVGAGPYLSLRDLAEAATALLFDHHEDQAVIPEVHCPGQGDGDISEVPIFPNRLPGLPAITGEHGGDLAASSEGRPVSDGGRDGEVGIQRRQPERKATSAMSPAAETEEASRSAAASRTSYSLPRVGIVLVIAVIAILVGSTARLSPDPQAKPGGRPPETEYQRRLFQGIESSFKDAAVSAPMNSASYVAWVYAQVGDHWVPNEYRELAKVGEHIVGSDYRPGDILLFALHGDGTVNFATLYWKDDQVVYVSPPVRAVRYVSLSDPSYAGSLVEARRISAPADRGAKVYTEGSAYKELKDISLHGFDGK